MNAQAACILEMKNCRKEFPGVIALDDVSLYVRRGEVHALLGENGAGKSTIMKILAGIYTLDGGEMLLDGKPLHVKNPADAMDKGISMIHQELDLIPDMTVEQNMFAGREKTGPFCIVNKKALKKQAQKILDDMHLKISAAAYVRDLSVAQMQMVAIAKATSVNADIIIMDEPTSAIPDKEVDELFAIINHLKKRNKAIIYISHRLEEIFKIADRITVLRDGKLIGSKLVSEVDSAQLVRMMVGRELQNMFVKSVQDADYRDGEIMLEVDGLTHQGVFENICFKLHRGEILGVAGLMGAGRTEVMEAIFGMRRIDAGSIIMKGTRIKIQSPNDAIRNGLAFITEDRKLYGLNLVGSVKTNISMTYSKLVTKWNFLMDLKKERELIDQFIEKLHVKTPNCNVIVNNLSGGNQQKVVISKWLMGKPDILIMDEPTRGIDVGAKAEIYHIMDNLVQQGNSIIMISSEMPELLGMSDRIIVLSQGKITGEFLRRECNQENLMACAIGEGSI
jgi:ABC-type sugar transport system ATPase subunit